MQELNYKVLKNVAYREYLKFPNHVMFQFEDLYQEGFFGLLEAHRTYEESKGVFNRWCALKIKTSIITARRKFIHIKEKYHIYPEQPRFEAIEYPVWDLDGSITVYNQLLDKNPSAFDLLTTKEVVTAISKAIKKLTKHQQKIVKAIYIEDMRAKELAANLCISDQAVACYKKRIIKKLKLILIHEFKFTKLNL